MKTRTQKASSARKQSRKEKPTRNARVYSVGNPEQAEGVGRRRIGTASDHSATEKQNQ